VLPAGYRQDDLGSGDRAVRSVREEPVTDAGAAKTEDVQNLRGGSAERQGVGVSRRDVGDAIHHHALVVGCAPVF
jgi:hypothetical protein